MPRVSSQSVPSYSQSCSLSKSYEADEKAVTAYVCHICDKHVRSKGSLKRHCRLHDPESKLFACPFPGCSKSFRQRENLVVHTSVHTGERPFECDICFKSFKSSSAVWHHRKRQTCSPSGSRSQRASSEESFVTATSTSSFADSILPSDVTLPPLDVVVGQAAPFDWNAWLQEIQQTTHVLDADPFQYAQAPFDQEATYQNLPQYDGPTVENYAPASLDGLVATFGNAADAFDMPLWNTDDATPPEMFLPAINASSFSIPPHFDASFALDLNNYSVAQPGLFPNDMTLSPIRV